MSDGQIQMLEEIVETSDDEVLVEAAQAKLVKLRAEQSEEALAAEATLEARLVDVEIRAQNERNKRPITVFDGVRDRVPGSTR